jgi:hypothetical protein
MTSILRSLFDHNKNPLMILGSLLDCVKTSFEDLRYYTHIIQKEAYSPFRKPLGSFFKNS